MMGRWQPETRTRLEAAAMELYAERGFEQATVAEIASRAGLTERTFFRYFTDKREVLFGGSRVFTEALVNSVTAAPKAAAPIDAIATAFEMVGSFLEENRERSRHRQTIIDANTDLQERELIKLAKLSLSLTEALRRRGVADTTARLAAESGVGVFKIAFDHWLKADHGPNLAEVIRVLFDELKAVTGARGAPVGEMR